MAENEAPMILKLTTPGGVSDEPACDSVRLTLREGADDRGGGSVGILRDHAPAVMALAPGEVTASLEGRQVFRVRIGGGFASVRDNVITVITDSAETDGADEDER